MYIGSFYQFSHVAEPERESKFVKRLCTDHSVRGTVLLATEGINAVIVHPVLETLEAVISQLAKRPNFSNLRPLITQADPKSQPFDKLVVRVRPEIVSFGTRFDFTMPRLPRATPSEWLTLMQQQDTLVVDVRNQYEYSLGRFRDALQPKTQSFREFKEFLNQQTEIDLEQTVAIYCTGGIRCEKAAQAMHKSGFKTVVQLDRGILGYLYEVDDLYWWEGECFVFDQRVAVSRNLKEGKATLCLACGAPLTSQDKSSEVFNQGISCPSCYTTLTPTTLARRKERLRQIHLAQKRKDSDAEQNGSTIGVS